MAVVIRHPRSLLKEHREIRHTLGRIDAMLAHPPEKEARPDWLQDLTSRLRTLRPELEEHFASEQEGGLFEEIEREMPGMAETSRRLLHEHQEILERLDDLLDTASVMPPFDVPFQSFVSRARAFSEGLAAHESRENEILMQALEGGPGALD
jgi:iron-sulfur cluster repair protein YtfE (RIC family)